MAQALIISSGRQLVGCTNYRVSQVAKCVRGSQAMLGLHISVIDRLQEYQPFTAEHHAVTWRHSVGVDFNPPAGLGTGMHEL